jgi:chromosome segregation ATPase
MGQTDLQTILIKRLDDIQDKITDIGERLGTLDGKIIAIQEKIFSLEDKMEASENEGRVLRGAMRNSIERQEGAIRRINEEIKEMKENVRPLMALADAINRFYRSATYAIIIALVVGFFYLLFSEELGVIRSMIEVFMRGGGSR